MSLRWRPSRGWGGVVAGPANDRLVRAERSVAGLKSRKGRRAASPDGARAPFAPL
jgi:hypothetical protein